MWVWYPLQPAENTYFSTQKGCIFTNDHLLTTSWLVGPSGGHFLSKSTKSFRMVGPSWNFDHWIKNWDFTPYRRIWGLSRGLWGFYGTKGYHTHIDYILCTARGHELQFDTEIRSIPCQVLYLGVFRGLFGDKGVSHPHLTHFVHKKRSWALIWYQNQIDTM